MELRRPSEGGKRSCSPSELTPSFSYDTGIFTLININQSIQTSLLKINRLIAMMLVMCANCTAFGLSSTAHADYVGYSRCKGCHNRPYKTWWESKHAGASDGLTEDQKRDIKCMHCHGTGTELGQFLEGVQCEACHGPGSLYKGPKIMSKGRYNADPRGQRKLAIEAGLIPQQESVCLQCHKQDRPQGHLPAREFNYKEAFGKVNHK
jgi:hypothetical protein